MLALTLTLITAVYILGPELISRYILGFAVPRRTIQQTNSEEISRAIITAIIPLGLAVAWVTLRHVITWGPVAADVHTYTTGILSQKFFDEHTAQFFSATKTVLLVFWAVGWRLYVLLIVYALIIDLVIYFYGEIRNSNWMSKHPFWRSVLATFVLPRISEWHILLKNVSHKKSVDIKVDIITRSDVLYRGTVEDLIMSSNGTLSGLLLTTPYRYQREKYLSDLARHKQQQVDAKASSDTKPNPDKYWKPIPGHAFLVLADHIGTINLRTYEQGGDQELLNRLKQILDIASLSAGTSLDPTAKPPST